MEARHMTKTSSEELLKALKSESFDDMLDIFDVMAAHIKKRRNKDENLKTTGYHFLERIKVNFVKGITEEDPYTDYASAMLIVEAPLIEKESEEAKSERVKEIKKDWFPIIGSHNIRVAKELLKIFLRGATNEAVENFMTKVKERKNKRESNNN